jgi:hypothetical protein
MSIRYYTCKNHSIIDPVCNNHSPPVLLWNVSGGTGCMHSAVQIWYSGTMIMEIHLDSVRHVTKLIQSLVYIVFHENIHLIVC